MLQNAMSCVLFWTFLTQLEDGCYPRRQNSQFFCDDFLTLRRAHTHNARGKAREEPSGVGTEVSTALSRPHSCAVKRAALQRTLSTPSNRAFPPKCILGEHAEEHIEKHSEEHTGEHAEEHIEKHSGEHTEGPTEEHAE